MSAGSCAPLRLLLIRFCSARRFCRAVLIFLFHQPAVPVNATRGVDKLLLARVKRVAIGADFNPDFLDGRSGRKCIAARARHCGVGEIGWVDGGFHDRGRIAESWSRVKGLKRKFNTRFIVRGTEESNKLVNLFALLCLLAKSPFSELPNSPETSVTTKNTLFRASVRFPRFLPSREYAYVYSWPAEKYYAPSRVRPQSFLDVPTATPWQRVLHCQAHERRADHGEDGDNCGRAFGTK